MGDVDLSTTDPLLGIFNSRYLQETLPREAEFARTSGQSLSIVLVDLDHFEWIRDTYGQQTGDAVLQHTVNLTRSALRHADWMARYGEEELVVVLPGTHLDGAYAAAERMRRRCAENAFVLPTSPLVVTASFGVACIDSISDPDGHEMLHEAADALRESQRAGCNRVTCSPARSHTARSQAARSPAVEVQPTGTPPREA